MNKMVKNITNVNGICNNIESDARVITLIALIVTIIVLLILAGVAINGIAGDNRYFNKSTRIKV